MHVATKTWRNNSQELRAHWLSCLWVDPHYVHDCGCLQTLHPHRHPTDWSSVIRPTCTSAVQPDMRLAGEYRRWSSVHWLWATKHHGFGLGDWHDHPPSEGVSPASLACDKSSAKAEISHGGTHNHHLFRYKPLLYGTGISTSTDFIFTQSATVWTLQLNHSAVLCYKTKHNSTRTTLFLFDAGFCHICKWIVKPCTHISYMCYVRTCGYFPTPIVLLAEGNRF